MHHLNVSKLGKKVDKFGYSLALHYLCSLKEEK